jgi:hypothetical protein
MEGPDAAAAPRPSRAPDPSVEPDPLAEPDASAAPDDRRSRRYRWMLAVFRVATALVAIDFLSTRHRWFQIVAVPLGLLALWWDWRLGSPVLTVALLVFLVYRLVVRVIERLVLPRRTRRALLGAKDEIRSELDRLDLPTGPLSGLRFAWRLVRGKRPHAELLTRMNQGIHRLGPIVSRATTELDNL